MNDTGSGDVEHAPCSQCGKEIEAGVRECPECGYDPKRSLRVLAGVCLLLAAALSLLSWIIWPLFFVTPVALLGAVLLFLLSFTAPSATGSRTFRVF